jgi:hypothetical protein
MGSRKPNAASLANPYASVDKSTAKPLESPTSRHSATECLRRGSRVNGVVDRLVADSSTRHSSCVELSKLGGALLPQLPRHNGSLAFERLTQALR